MRERPAPFFIFNYKNKTMATTLSLNPAKTNVDAARPDPEAIAAHDLANAILISNLAKSEESSAAPAAPTPAAPGNPFSEMIGKRAWIVAVHGDMVNLHTNERFTSDPKKTTIDQFLASQLEAKKMVLHVEEE